MRKVREAKTSPKNEILFSREMEKEVQKCWINSRTPNLMFPRHRVESWHLAAAIDDPGPVAVASQGSSLSHSA